MDENRVAGTARNLGGKAEEVLGRTTADTDLTAEGSLNQIKGTAQSHYGQVRDSASETTGSAQQAGSSFERMLRSTIEQQPYTAIAIALGLGWLLGRSHRPL
jgi:uncharacterized protein YjbJ (UPF0337 family)